MKKLLIFVSEETLAIIISEMLGNAEATIRILWLFGSRHLV
jgi:hypothetical protein